MDEIALYEKAVDSIYDAAHSNSWDSAIRDCATFVGAIASALVVLDKTSMTVPVSQQFGYGEAWHEYTTHYAALDPVAEAVAKDPQANLYLEQMYVSETERRNSEYYDWQFRASPHHHTLGARLLSTGSSEAFLILGRSKTQGAGSKNNLQKLAQVQQHLRRSITLARKFGARDSTAALDSLSLGVLIIDHSGRVTFANRTMNSIGAANDGITLTAQGGIMLSLPDENAAYQRMFEHVRRRLFLDAGSERMVVRASRPSGKRPYGIIVCPFKRHDIFAVDGEPAVMVCVSDPSLNSHLSEDTLAALFGLTSAEARLALALISCGSLGAAAQHCGLTDGSARQYLKRIFSKTDTQGQVELVTLIMGTVRG